MKMRIVAGVIVVFAVLVFAKSSHPVATWIGQQLGFEPQKLVPDMDGQVVAVNGEQGIVVLSVGSNDGVESGHEFTVFRKDTFIGKVRATKVTPDLSGARILYLHDAASVNVGDSATTRISD